MTSHRVTVGMGRNANGNTAVKWMRDEQCSLYLLLTLLTACCSCMDCIFCSIGLETDYVSLYSLIHYAQSRHKLVLICGDGVGMGTYVAGTGGDGYRGCGDGFCVHGDRWGWGSVSVLVQTSNVNGDAKKLK